jgi:hypothetical protein
MIILKLSRAGFHDATSHKLSLSSEEVYEIKLIQQNNQNQLHFIIQ